MEKLLSVRLENQKNLISILLISQQIDSARTSYGAFLSGKLKKDPVLKSLAQKIEEWTQLPQENGEDFYLLRYAYNLK